MYHIHPSRSPVENRNHLFLTQNCTFSAGSVCPGRHNVFSLPLTLSFLFFLCPTSILLLLSPFALLFRHPLILSFLYRVISFSYHSLLTTPLPLHVLYVSSVLRPPSSLFIFPLLRTHFAFALRLFTNILCQTVIQ